MGITVYLAGLAGSALASIGLTPLVVAAARKWGVVDLPNSRKVHQAPTPRLGGLAIAGAALAVGVPLLLLCGAFSAAAGERKVGLVVTLAAAAFVLLVGFFDDLLNLHSKFKLLALLAAATAVCGAGVRIDSILIHGWDPIPLGWGAWPVTLLWIVGVTVSINFIDGLDGLAAGICAVACGVIAATAVHSHQPALAVLSLTLLGSLGGFLLFNFHPARVFMGDCGSMFIGFSLACYALLDARRVGTTTGLMLPALALSVPLLDTALTLVRRTVIFRRSIFSAERGHIHHRLLDLGLGQKHAVLVLYGATVVSAGVGILALLEGGWATVAGLTLLVPVLAALFHVAGSARVRETIAAVRRNRAIAREAAGYQRAFEELQLRFRPADTFERWWQEVCTAARMLDFVRVNLPLTRRDGTTERRVWHRSDTLFMDCETLGATVPIRQRRAGGPLRAEVDVAVHTMLESAGNRIALFSRLMGEHSLAQLDDPSRRVKRSRGPADTGGAGATTSAASEGEKPTEGHSRAAVAVPPQGRHRRSRRSPLPAAAPAAPILAGDWASDRADRPRVAIVHDFLYCYAGAERVLEQMLLVFPDADLFSLFDFIPEGQRGFLGDRGVRTSFIQRLPLARRKHRAYLPLMPLAIEQMDLSGYDVVVSSSYLVAKGVITRPGQLHVCYCHTPVRFAWDLQNQYLGEAGMSWGLKSLAARLILHYIRNWDVRSANGVDVFLSNSDFVGRRIEKVYRRRSRTLYPPVDTARFTPGEGDEPREDFYLTASRMVPYKRVDLIVEAFASMPDRRLVVVGDGPEFEKIKAKATPNVRLVGHQPFEKLRQYMQLARAFVFAAEEDFGIVPVEAQACGTPVIAYGSGGVRESVVEGRTGVFFAEQTPASVARAVREFERGAWDPDVIRLNAERFSAGRFREDFERVVRAEWLAFRANQAGFPQSGPAEATVAAPIDAPGEAVEVGLPASELESLSRTAHAL